MKAYFLRNSNLPFFQGGMLNCWKFNDGKFISQTVEKKSANKEMGNKQTNFKDLSKSLKLAPSSKTFHQISLNKFCCIERKIIYAFSLASNKLCHKIYRSINIVPTFLLLLRPCFQCLNFCPFYGEKTY